MAGGGGNSGFAILCFSHRWQRKTPRIKLMTQRMIQDFTFIVSQFNCRTKSAADRPSWRPARLAGQECSRQRGLRQGRCVGSVRRGLLSLRVSGPGRFAPQRSRGRQVTGPKPVKMNRPNASWSIGPRGAAMPLHQAGPTPILARNAKAPRHRLSGEAPNHLGLIRSSAGHLGDPHLTPISPPTR